MSRMEIMESNNNYELEKIKQVYQKTNLVINDRQILNNYHTRLNRNFIPEQIIPMYSDISEYDYIKPIIKLNSRYSNSYYERLIKFYDYNKKDRLDLYSGINLDKVDLELNDKAMQQALEKEEALSYMAPSGRYWEIEKELDSSQLRKIDTLWLQTVSCA